MATVFQFLAANGVLVLFIIVGLGMILGHIKLRGTSLGAAAVLFLAIGISAWSNSYGVTLKIDHTLGIFGLALFAFAIGVNSGPNFFHALKTATGPIIGLVAVLCLAGGSAHVFGNLLGMDKALIAGTYAGAITNTPALNAAGNVTGDPELATVGYSIAYLFGVVGMLIVCNFAIGRGKADKDTPSPLVNRTIRVDRDDLPSIGDLMQKFGSRVTYSRLRRGEIGPISRPVASDVLSRDDLITVVAPKELVTRIVTELGHGSSHSLTKDRVYLDFRRITVSDPKLAGHPISELDMDRKFSATISRVRRGDVDMSAEPDLVLQQGDRVRVVAPTTKIGEISKFFGDSARGLSDINPIALGLGMALGILLGELPILTPSGDTFSLGSTAGTLIVGLIFGRIGRIGKVVTALPYTACMVLSELGILMFLAQAGTNAGGQIANAFTGGSWWRIFLLGFIVTTVSAVGLYLVMRLMFHMGGTRLAGLLGGAQTQPAVLAFANGKTGFDPRVALGYAMVYPMSMIAKILIAQIVGIL